jgi:hypothetical protein
MVTLVPVPVFADRRLDGEPEQATDGRHHADLGLGPMLLGDQEHVEIRPQRAAHVGQQEVDGVETPVRDWHRPSEASLPVAWRRRTRRDGTAR